MGCLSGFSGHIAIYLKTRKTDGTGVGGLAQRAVTQRDI